MHTLPTQLNGMRPPNETVRLMEKAQDLEAAFLSEMLSHAGLDAPSGGFDGGTGEEQFSSFLRNEQARLMVESGGIGLAKTIFDSLVKQQEARDGA